MRNILIAIAIIITGIVIYFFVFADKSDDKKGVKSVETTMEEKSENIDEDLPKTGKVELPDTSKDVKVGKEEKEKKVEKKTVIDKPENLFDSKIEYKKGEYSGEYKTKGLELNIRKHPNLNSASIGYISVNDTFSGYQTEVEKNSKREWLYVDNNGTKGWVSKTYVKLGTEKEIVINIEEVKTQTKQKEKTKTDKPIEQPVKKEKEDIVLPKEETKPQTNQKEKPKTDKPIEQPVKQDKEEIVSPKEEAKEEKPKTEKQEEPQEENEQDVDIVPEPGPEKEEENIEPEDKPNAEGSDTEEESSSEEEVGEPEVDEKEEVNEEKPEEDPEAEEQITYETVVEEETVKHKTIKKEDSTIEVGKEKVERKGVNGNIKREYKVGYKDGKEVSRELINETKVNPVDEIILIGTKPINNKIFESPVKVRHYMTSDYGYRYHPITGTYRHHNGIDLATGRAGDKIHAAGSGTVIEAGPASGYGNWIVIDHHNGYFTIYAHMYSNGIYVSKGQKVTSGQHIADIGSSGDSTGPHLHFEVSTGRANGTGAYVRIDPKPLTNFTYGPR